MIHQRNWHGVAAGLAIVAALAFAAVFTGVRAGDVANEGYAAGPAAGSMMSMAMMTNDPWTCVGSAGMVVDEKDLKEYGVKGSIVEIPRGVDHPATVNLRYNVVAAPGLVNRLDGWQMVVRFRDNGADARVLVKLRSYNMNTGTTRNLMVFDSNDEDRSGQFQNGFVVDCAPEFIFNFASNVYFLDVTLTKSGDRGKPAIGGIQIGPIDCP